MNSHSTAFPNAEVSSSYQLQKYNPSNTINEAKVALTFSRYRRRSVITRYNLDDQTNNIVNPEILDHSKGIGATTNVSSFGSEETTSDPPASPHKCYSRRCSVTRFSLQQGETKTIHETRSLSPVPIARRGSVTTSTAVVEAAAPPFTGADVSKHETTIEEEQLAEDPVPAPRHRYSRRCSVTKYSLDAAQVVAQSAVTHQRYQRRCSVTKYSLPTMASTNDINKYGSSFSLTVLAEPVDTVDSLEHQQMLANDTIESSGAGDLLVGWSQAKAADGAVHTQKTTNMGSNNNEQEDESVLVVGEFICGFEARRSMILNREQQEEEKQWSPPSSPEVKSAYFLGILSKRFSVRPSWVVTSLESEVPMMRSIPASPSA